VTCVTTLHSTWQRGYYTFLLLIGHGFNTLPNFLFQVRCTGRLCLMHFGFQVTPQEKICRWKIRWVSRPVDVSALRNVSLWKHIMKNFLTYSSSVGRAMMIQFIRQEIFQQNFIWLSTDNQNMVCVVLKELKVNNVRIITYHTVTAHIFFHQAHGLVTKLCMICYVPFSSA